MVEKGKEAPTSIANVGWQTVADRIARRYRKVRRVGSRGVSCFSGRRGLLWKRRQRLLAHVYFLVWNALRSGICTRNSFLHSFGLVMCAGMKGYYDTRETKEYKNGRRADHERFKVGPPPLCEAISDLPFVVNAMYDAELLRVSRWRKAIVEAPFKTVDLILTGFEVVTGSTDRFSKGARGRDIQWGWRRWG